MSTTKPVCAVIGDAMIDVSFPIHLENYVDLFTRGGAISSRLNIAPGGTANVAYGLADLGVSTAFVGKIGNDVFGSYFMEEESPLLRYYTTKSDEYTTGVVFSVILPNKERFFLVDRGANSYLHVDDIPFDVLLGVSYLYCSGYSFQDSITFKSLQHTVAQVQKNGVSIIFNPGAPNLVNVYKKEMIDFIKNFVNVLILNESEWFELSSGRSKETYDELFSACVDIVVLTKGVKGSVINMTGTQYHIKPCYVNVVDTTGAGDAYASAFIYGLKEDWDLLRIGEFASNYASKVISSYGPRIRSC